PRGDPIGRVVEPVDEIEDEGDEDDEDDEGEHRSDRHGHAILRMIPSITVSTSSHRAGPLPLTAPIGTPRSRETPGETTPHSPPRGFPQPVHLDRVLVEARVHVAQA